jgi:hypothetical protein
MKIMKLLAILAIYQRKMMGMLQFTPQGPKVNQNTENRRRE